MKPFLIVLAVLSTISLSSADPLDPQPLWPEGVPGEADPELPEESVKLRGEDKIQIISDVSNPTLTWYPAPDPNGASVLVCPGGGYNVLAYSHEGTEVCEWLNTVGISAGLLKYRVPRREGRPKHEAPLEDVHRAIGIMRTNAVKWNIDPERLGILGFSAGGHLSTMAMTYYGERTYPVDPSIDNVSVIPNFAVLVYPAYLLDDKNPDDLSSEIAVTAETPPTFLVVSDDDSRFVEGAARFYIEMHRRDRPCELHIFAKGSHGFGFDKTDNEVKQWPALAGKWMEVMGFLKTRQ